MNQSINTDSKNSKEPQQKYRLGTVSIKILGGLNRFYRRLTSPSASIMAQNIQLFGPRGGFLTHQWISMNTDPTGPFYNTHTVPSQHCLALPGCTAAGGTRHRSPVPIYPLGSIKRIFPEYQKTFLNLVAGVIKCVCN